MTTLPRFVRFVLAAGLSVPVNIGMRVVLSRIVPFEVAVALSHVAGMLTAYTFSKLFVFEPSGKTVQTEMRGFALVNLWSLAQTWTVSVGLVRFVFPAIDFDRSPELVAHIIGLGLTAFTSYWGHRRFSFSSS